MIEQKVQASALGGAVSGVILWAMATYLFKDVVPDAVALLISLAVPALVTFVAGYIAPHTVRGDLGELGDPEH